MQEELNKFVEVAQQFCQWAESEPHHPQKDLAQAQRLLAELHWAVLLLPEIRPENDHATIPVPPEIFAQVQQRFATLPVQGYWDVFNPLREEEAVFNSLADDLADIYQDIKEYFPLYEQGHYDEALWHWRFNFQIHWGHHLLGAQRAIHLWLFYS